MTTESKVELHPSLTTDRLKAFADGVAAIAITLLILPLTESVAAAAADDMSTGEWYAQVWPQIFSFGLSFALIANFWVSHHRLFDRVERVTTTLAWLTIAWMATIVWLPVATALVGQMNTDALQALTYIGTMLLTSLILLTTRIYIRAHPELHSIEADRLRMGLRAEIVVSLLFVIALVVAIGVPAIGYASLSLLLLTAPLLSVMRRIRPG